MAADDQGSPLFALDLKILSLNISGLRKKTSYLRQIISKYCPDIICLQETNISDDYSKYKALYELGLDKEICFFNYPLSKSNGTAILCNAPGLKIKNISGPMELSEKDVGLGWADLRWGLGWRLETQVGGAGSNGH